MGTPLSTILEPANQLRDLLFVPKIIYLCAFFAYEGLRYGITLTHGGMRKGMIARLYGVMYLLVCLGSLWRFPNDLKKFLAIDPSTIKAALLFTDPFPQFGFIFIGLALFMLLISEGVIRYSEKKNSRRSRKVYRAREARNFLYWMVAFPFAIGVQLLLGLPEWVNVAIFAFFAYFAPFTSPQKLKLVLSLPDEKHQSTKSAPQPDQAA